MPMLGLKERDFLTKEFSQKLTNEVRLVVFTQEMPCVFCKETVEVCQDIASVNPKIKVEVYDFVKDQMKAKELRIDKIPAIAVIGVKDYGVRFYGIPSGYEFTSLIGSILDVSKGDSGLSPKNKDLLKSLDRPIHIQVFVTPTCPFCPTAVRLAHRLSIESDFIWADMVESNEFVPLAQKYGVMGVPKTVINERQEISGVLPEDLLVLHVLNATREQEPLQPR
jgi:glutaredoxin-like protein